MTHFRYIILRKTGNIRCPRGGHLWSCDKCSGRCSASGSL
jgi:hypothetical protein